MAGISAILRSTIVAKPLLCSIAAIIGYGDGNVIQHRPARFAAYSVAAWFKTRENALLTMRVSDLIQRRPQRGHLDEATKPAIR